MQILWFLTEILPILFCFDVFLRKTQSSRINRSISVFYWQGQPKKCKYYDFLLKFYQFFFALTSFLEINKAPGLKEVFQYFEYLHQLKVLPFARCIFQRRQFKSVADMKNVFLKAQTTFLLISIPRWILIMGAGENYRSIKIYFPCFAHKIQIINWEEDLRRIELVARELLNAKFQARETFAKQYNFQSITDC